MRSTDSEQCTAWHLQGFRHWMQIQHWSHSTQKGYLSSINQFITWCAERSITEPVFVQRHHLQRYQRYLYNYRSHTGTDAEKPLSLKTQLLKLIGIRTYFRYMVKQKYLVLSPAAELDLPKEPRTLPKHILSIEEMHILLGLCKLSTATGMRDRCMFELLYSTGIRRAELCNLRLVHLQLLTQTVLIRQGKGGHDRTVPLSDRALHWLDRYLTDARPQLVGYQDPGLVFVTPEGTAIKPDSLSALIKRYIRRANISADSGGAHLFRHACATHMLEGGADIRFVQELLGHASLKTTQIYTRVSVQKLRQVQAQTHPLGRAGQLN